MYWSLFTIVFGLRSKTQGPRLGGPFQHPGNQTETSLKNEPEEEWILCRQCHQRISLPSERTQVNGAHQHTFANPSGIVYEIACFHDARGCHPAGMPSNDFTWFSGHSWQVVLCSHCLVHLGWRFTSNLGMFFFGLIVDRIEHASSGLQ